MKRSLQFVPIFLFLFISLLITNPTANELKTHIIGDGGDTLEYYSYLYVFRENLLNGRWPFSSTPVYRYPNGVNMALTEAKIFVAAGGLLSFLASPTVVYNLLVILVFTANAFVSYIFYLKVTNNSKPVALLGGFINGFSFWNILNGYGSISVLLQFGFPLMGLIIVRIIRRGITLFDSVFVAIGFAVLSLSNVTGFMQGLIISLTSVIISLVIWRIRPERIISLFLHNILPLMLGIVFFLVLNFLSLSSHIERLYQAGLPMSDILFAPPKIPISAIIYPPSNSYPSLMVSILKKYGTVFPNNTWWYETNYVGSLILLLIIIVLPRTISSRTGRYFYILTTLCFIASVSGHFSFPLPAPEVPSWLTYPIYYLSQNYHYFIMPFWFFAGGTIAIGLHNARTKTIVTISIICLLILERLNTGYPLTEIKNYNGSTYSQKVRNLPGAAVLDIPLDVYSKYNLLPFAYGKPIVGGMVHWYGDNERQRSFLNQPEIARFSCNTNGESWQDIVPPPVDLLSPQNTASLNMRLVGILTAYDIRTVVIHKKYFSREKCTLMRRQSDSLFTGHNRKPFQLVFDNQDVQVYQLTGL